MCKKNCSTFNSATLKPNREQQTRCPETREYFMHRKPTHTRVQTFDKRVSLDPTAASVWWEYTQIPVNAVCVCVWVLCKPHYLYHYIKFLSLSLSEIIEHLEKHQSATQTHYQTLTNAHMPDFNTHTHSDKHKHPQKGQTQYGVWRWFTTLVIIAISLGPSVKRCLIVSLSFPPSRQLPHEKYISVLATKFTSPPPLHSLSLSPSTSFAQSRN